MRNAAAVGCKSGSSNCRGLIVDTSRWAASGASDALTARAGLFQFDHIAPAGLDLLLPEVGLEALGERDVIAVGALRLGRARMSYITPSVFHRGHNITRVHGIEL